jgi:hypothetical protein
MLITALLLSAAARAVVRAAAVMPGAGQVQAGQDVQVHVGVERGLGREGEPPETAALGDAGRGKLTTKWKRRVKAWSMFSLRLLIRIIRPSLASRRCSR